jgi:hypothetical protein
VSRHRPTPRAEAPDQGKEAVVGILDPGPFFGEGCMNGHSLRIATSTATEESLITSISKSAMIAVLHDEPKVSELFVAYLLTRNSWVEDDLIDQLFNSSEKRLARLLLLLAKFGKEGSPTPISPNISQETLAEMIGTTRSRVSFFMNKFRNNCSTQPQHRVAQIEFLRNRGDRATARHHKFSGLALVIFRKRSAWTSFHATPPGSLSLLQVSTLSEEVQPLH